MLIVKLKMVINLVVHTSRLWKMQKHQQQDRGLLSLSWKVLVFQHQQWVMRNIFVLKEQLLKKMGTKTKRIQTHSLFQEYLWHIRVTVMVLLQTFWFQQLSSVLVKDYCKWFDSKNTYFLKFNHKYWLPILIKEIVKKSSLIS